MEGKSATLVEFSIQILHLVQLAVFSCLCDFTGLSPALGDSGVFSVVNQAEARQETGLRFSLLSGFKAIKGKVKIRGEMKSRTRQEWE